MRWTEGSVQSFLLRFVQLFITLEDAPLYAHDASLPVENKKHQRNAGVSDFLRLGIENERKYD